MRKDFNDILSHWLGELPNQQVPFKPHRVGAYTELLQTLKDAGFTRDKINVNRIIELSYNPKSGKKKEWKHLCQRDLDIALSRILPKEDAIPEYVPNEHNSEEPVEESKPTLKTETKPEEVVNIPPPAKKPIPPPPSERDLPPRPHVIYDEDMEYILGFKK